ncbi:MAG: ADP-ribosylation/Crystallin J1, partial [Chloroflexi bacterium]|nr:ADP-ribosylation/Crystallin J1 [Chloroflexota bacterium]
MTPTLSSPGSRYQRELETAVRAAVAAGDALRAEFHRPGGPRVHAGNCQADGDAELAVRDILGQAFPDYGVRGEEMTTRDRTASDDEEHVWVIDPNDGTEAFGKGWRGAAVSIALLRKGVPVLGVINAYAARAGKGDLLAWAEGQPFTRNGQIVEGHRPIATVESATVMVSQDADKNPQANLKLCAPARFRAVPSIAYRLALVAAGEGIAAVSLNGPGHLDVAAGHALLRSAGYELYRMGGEPVSYAADGTGHVGNCVGGEKGFAQKLSLRDWRQVFKPSETGDSRFKLLRPDPAAICSDEGLLARAQGCMIGQMAGDNLGALVESMPASVIARMYPNGFWHLQDGGYWKIIAGQPTDDS